jgi:predicted O-methyltransferase YrrM
VPVNWNIPVWRWINWLGDDDDEDSNMGDELAQLPTFTQTAPPPSPAKKNILRTIAQTAVQRHGALQKPSELAGFLAVLVDMVPKPRIMVEIGCDAGGTLWAWRQIGVPQVIGIEGPQTHGEDNPWGTENLLVDHGCEVIRGDSHADETRTALADLLAGEPIDVLFIDGDHTYEGVKQDFLMYAPMVANEGMIVFHDVSPHPSHPGVGVQKFWQQVNGDKEEILNAPDTWGGIGFVRQWPDEPVTIVRR